jgi:hypothetical protein
MWLSDTGDLWQGGHQRPLGGDTLWAEIQVVRRLVNLTDLQQCPSLPLEEWDPLQYNILCMFCLLSILLFSRHWLKLHHRPFVGKGQISTGKAKSLLLTFCGISHLKFLSPQLEWGPWDKLLHLYTKTTATFQRKASQRQGCLYWILKEELEFSRQSRRVEQSGK